MRVLFAAIVLVLSSVVALGQQTRQSNQTPEAGAPGRYQILFSPHGDDGYLLDTAGGTVWHLEKTNMEPFAYAWIFMARIDDVRQFGALRDLNRAMKEGKTDTAKPRKAPTP
jgi:hypothetical protein